MPNYAQRRAPTAEITRDKNRGPRMPTGGCLPANLKRRGADSRGRRFRRSVMRIPERPSIACSRDPGSAGGSIRRVALRLIALRTLHPADFKTRKKFQTSAGLRNSERASVSRRLLRTKSVKLVRVLANEGHVRAKVNESTAILLQPRSGARLR